MSRQRRRHKRYQQEKKDQATSGLFFDSLPHPLRIILFTLILVLLTLVIINHTAMSDLIKVLLLLRSLLNDNH